MVVNGADVVEQLRGRMKFYHVGDPVRKDLDWACEEISDLRIEKVLMQVLIDEAEKRLEEAEKRLERVVDATSVGDWLDEQGIKLMPWQRKRLGLTPSPKEPRKAMNT